MKRKGLLYVALTILICLLSLCFIACNEEPHVHEYKMQISDTMHWLKCDCGDTKDFNVHSGGTATCIEKAKCSVCGERHGELGDHSYEEWKTNNNSTHSKTCIYDSTHVITENCSGGTATEEERATCEVCNGKYGSPLNHTHNFNKQEVKETYLKSKATCEERAVYYYSCSCGEKGNTTFEVGETLGHAYGEWISNGDNTHTKTCSNDNNHKITENCNGGTATCAIKAVCKDCKTSYGQLKDHPVEDWTTTETHHYQQTTCSCNLKLNYGEHQTDDSGFCAFCDKAINPTVGILYDASSDGTYAEVIGYNGTSTKINIASNYNNLPVKSIYKEAFMYSSIKSVVIPDSVTSIGVWAFYGCESLTSVTIGNSVTSIGSYAFSFCDLLKSVTIPDSVTSIGSYAFSSCDSLRSVTIPDSVTSIGYYAFEYCISLQYYIEGNLKYLGNTNNPYLYLADVTSTSIPSATINENCKFIGYKAFYYCYSLTSIEIPNSVTSIGDEAFYYCESLTSVTIGNGVTSIGDEAFSLCYSLTSIIVDANNLVYKSINGNLYSKNGKELIQYAIGKTTTSFSIPDSVTSIGYEAFSGCYSLKSVTIGNSVTSIGSSAFYACRSLTSVTIPDSVTSIGEEAFRYCESLTSVTIGNSVTSIGDYAFYGCRSLTSVTFSDTSTWYQIYVFGDNAYDNWQNKTGGAEIDVTDASNNAWYFKSTYYWYKI